MKIRYLIWLLTVAVTAVRAQTPTGFSAKQKQTVRKPGETARLLRAERIAVPTDKTTAAARISSNLSTELLKLKVVRDTASGLPVFIERKNKPKPSAANARRSAAAATREFLGQVRQLLQLENPNTDFDITQTQTDALGQTHVRLAQTYRGIRVLGSELVAHLDGGEVGVLNGRYQPIRADVAVKPTLTLPEAARLALADVGRQTPIRARPMGLFRRDSVAGQLSLFVPKTGKPQLAYALTVRPNLLERWEYVLDAQTGEVLEKYNHTCTFDGGNRTTAKDVNGISRTIQTYQVGGRYYMIDGSKPMFKANQPDMPNDPQGVIWTVDAKETYGDNEKITQITSSNNADWNATAVSAHYNAGVVYDYYLNTHKLNALDTQGGTIISVINVVDDDGTGLDNAYWNGELMAYGNGNKVFKPLAGALDVAAHEMTHGVIQSTANLKYQDQPGAINESMADVFGVLVDRDDWTLGEDVMRNRSYYQTGALRDMSNPNQGGEQRDPNGYQPATMSQYVTTEDDNGGVHINSGIPNFAFYKFATAVGRDKAEKVYFRALTTYLVRTSQFLDLRLAVIKAAGDLYGASGAEAKAAADAFTAVGITEGTATTTPSTSDLPVASGQDLILLTDESSKKLYSATVGQSNFQLKSNYALTHRPSVTDDGQTAYYVTGDKRIRAVNLVGTPTEEIISDQTIWDNVAISKDGSKLAALTADQDGKIYVYSYAQKKWNEFTLYNPTTNQGVTTGEVKYADSFEWDYSGEYIVYDAYNELTNTSGKAIDYWDVGLIRVWDNKTNAPAKGTIQKLFANLAEGESIGNPSFAKTSSNIIAFDYFNEEDDSYFVVTTDLATGSLKGVYENNDLGFPNYSRTDDQLVFDTQTQDKGIAIARIPMAANKLEPAGSASVLYTGAQWPVWYTQAKRSLPAKANQTITFDVIADRYFSDGDLVLKATSSAGLPVGFLVRSGQAKLSQNTLTFSGVGAVTVRAFQDGDTKTFAASPVDRTFNVLAVTSTINPNAKVLVYPNPVSQEVVVEVGSGTLEQLTLHSPTGGVVAQAVLTATDGRGRLDVSQLPKGLYVLDIKTSIGSARQKILKE